MSSDESIRAAALVFKNMTDEEATAYLAAGDYTSVAGIPLPEGMSKRIEALASEQEVQGFATSPSPSGPVPLPYPNTGLTPKTLDGASPKLYEAACKGTHIPEVTIEL